MSFTESRLCKALTASTVILGAAFLATLIILLVPRISYSYAPPPIFNRTVEVDWDTFINTTREAWPQENKDILVISRDECFLLYSLEDFSEFREYMRKFKFHKFSAEFNDCDDYATITHGREREWFTSHVSDSPCGSSFGVINGWLNFNYTAGDCENDRGHSMNYFVDADLRVWGYEPQIDELFLVPEQWCPTTYLDSIFI